MPLAFESLSHGTLAFGFFNIESDMLLLDRYFFFATDFCGLIEDIAGKSAEDSYQARWSVQWIESPANIGDLMGAIHGIRFSGFIGELYGRYPFPQRPEDFKQNPEGYQTQAEVSEIIAKYARSVEISVLLKNDGREIEIGEYRFSCYQFQELIKYVWLGGWPSWKNEIRPEYVLQMKNKIIKYSGRLFGGLNFNGIP